MSQKLYISSDTLVHLTDLTDEVDSTYVSDATCSLKIYDADGTQVGTTYSFSTDGTNSGDYYCVVPHSLTFVEDAEYTLEITAVKGSSQMHQHVTAIARTLAP